MGDADGNGEVDSIDVTVLQRYSADMEYPISGLETADVDGDGETTIIDATYIQRYLAEMDTPYRIGEAVGSSEQEDQTKLDKDSSIEGVLILKIASEKTQRKTKS